MPPENLKVFLKKILTFSIVLHGPEILVGTQVDFGVDDHIPPVRQVNDYIRLIGFLLVIVSTGHDVEFTTPAQS